MKLRRLIAIAVATAAVSAFAISALPATASSNSAVLGVYRGSGRPDLVSSYQTWLGGQVGYAVDFLPSGSSTSPWSAIDNPSWWCSQWKGKGWQLSLSAPMFPNTSFTLAAGASGSYDSHWLNFAKTMVSSGCGNAIIRIGWEFNGTFMPWAAGGKESYYAAYWRRIVTVLRSVSGQSFKFDWSPLAGDTHANVTAAYPGDAYVDIIGLDFYDLSPVSTAGANRWNEQLTRTYGLNWQRDFAATHGKTLSYPEWGLWNSSTLSSGDDTYYIDQMWNWVHTNPVTYAAYFEVDASDGSHRLMTTMFPNASAEYRKLVQANTSTTTTSTTSTTSTSTSTTSTTAAPTTTTTVPPTTTTTAPPTTTTTAPPSTTSVSLWSSGTTPGSISTDTKAAELGVKFRSDVPGKITGIRFYKGSGNTGTHVGSLWSRDGSLLAQATFSSESSSGWQTVTFSTPVSIQAGVTYVASYHTNTGHYASDPKYFNNSYDHAPLHALKKGTDGANGVYAYSSSPTFPSTGWTNNAPNYWVDVLFTAGL